MARKPKTFTCGVCLRDGRAARVHPRGVVCPVNGPDVKLPTERGKCITCGGGAFMYERHPALYAYGHTCLTCGTMKPIATD